VARTTSAKFGLQAGNLNFTKQNEELSTIVAFIVLLLYFSLQNLIVGTIDKNAIGHLSDGVAYFYHIFRKRISHVMHISVHELVKNFSELFWPSSSPLSGRGLKDVSSLQMLRGHHNTVAGNMLLASFGLSGYDFKLT
jgi:hypothetical protein